MALTIGLVLLLCFGTIAVPSPLVTITHYNSSLQISNLCIRFAWLIYVPLDGPSYILRGFIIAMLEMLRRVQWNFCASFSPLFLFFPLRDRATDRIRRFPDRLENEHLGNMDQYRVTREVPLPYNFDVQSNEEEEEREEEVHHTRSCVKPRMVRPNRIGGHG